MPPTLRALGQLCEFLTSAPSIVAGDFNQTVALDKNRPAGNRFADVLALMAEMGLTSAWHGHRAETHGAESNATLYWRWSEQAKYHIDFVFGSSTLAVEKTELGGFDQYVRGEISDHVPLSVDYRIL